MVEPAGLEREAAELAVVGRQGRLTDPHHRTRACIYGSEHAAIVTRSPEPPPWRPPPKISATVVGTLHHHRSDPYRSHRRPVLGSQYRFVT